MDTELLDDFEVEKEEEIFQNDKKEEVVVVGGGLYERKAKLVILITAFVDILGFSLPNPIMPYYYSRVPGFSHHNEGLWFGLIMSSFSVGQFFASIFGGVLTDRVGRRIPILVGLAANSVFMVWTAFAPNLVQLTIARGLAGTFAGTQGVCVAYVMDLTSNDERTRELAHLASVSQIGFIAGPAIGIAIGLAFGIPRVETAFLCVCLFAAVIAGVAFILGLFFLKEPDQVAGITLTNPLLTKSAFSVIGSLLKKRDILLVMLCTGLTTLSGTYLEALLPLLLVQLEKSEIYQVFFVFAGMAIFTPIVTGILYPPFSKKYGNKISMIFAFMINAGGMLLMPVFLFWVVQVLFGLLLAFAAVGGPALQSVASFNAGRTYGTVMGIIGASASLARMIGPVTSGALYDFNYQIPFYLAALFNVYAALCCVFMIRVDGDHKEDIEIDKNTEFVEMDQIIHGKEKI